MWCFRCQNHSFMTRWRHNSKINFIFSPAQNLKKPALKMVVPSQTRQIKKGFYTGVTSFYPQFVTSYLQRKFWLYFSRSEIRIDLITRFFSQYVSLILYQSESFWLNLNFTGDSRKRADLEKSVLSVESAVKVQNCVENIKSHQIYFWTPYMQNHRNSN